MACDICGYKGMFVCDCPPTPKENQKLKVVITFLVEDDAEAHALLNDVSQVATDRYYDLIGHEEFPVDALKKELIEGPPVFDPNTE